MLRIGIDPDVSKSGYAIWNIETRKLVEFGGLTFWNLFVTLKSLAPQVKEVIIEAGWLSRKSNWHNERQGVHVASRIGKNVGANHQCGKFIAEMCVYLKIPFRLVPPAGKVHPKTFLLITGIKEKNQDTIDAVMLVYQ